ncbi:hypothetical protein P3T36_006870 [Kitasatospora sp. MAP12-15]|uniref:helix-turn-helix domain-containing protein n=1 Tax=unclassified Kitasatospora TaxID=2633591 RepID=UPI00247300FF|nr:helix-turn-helix domain-containing protein [Kitasatospora sp. MAP12-44]MDH6111947.1 hypothetical protein [Kitasatospora sp. MAP12-44]
MRRRNNGAELRKAMKEAGLKIPSLTEATRRADPTGAGISQAMVGFVVGQGKTAREECSEHVAKLISTALGKPLTDLFIVELSVVVNSTSTPRDEMQTTTPDAGPEPLMTPKELLRYLRKSENWLDIEINEGRIEPIYVGRDRRFDRQQVLAELKAARTTAAA